MRVHDHVRLLAIICLVAALISLSAGPRVYAAGEAVTISVSATSVEVGNTVTVAVKASGFASIRAAQARLVFDPKVLQVAGNVVKGSVFSSGGIVAPIVDNAAGEIRFGGSFLGSTAHFNGTSGELFKVAFHTVGTGNSGLRFADDGTLDGLLIIDAAGKEYSAADISVTSAQVAVAGSPPGEEPAEAPGEGSADQSGENPADTGLDPAGGEGQNSDGGSVPTAGQGQVQGQLPPVASGASLEDIIIQQLEEQFADLPEEQKVKLLPFTDVKEHWAKAYIYQLITKNILSGYPDGTFRPNQNVTRAEFAKIIVSALGLENAATKALTFADEKSIPRWSQKYVSIAAEHKLVAGYQNSEGKLVFDANRRITRQEAAVMIARALRSAGVPISAGAAKNTFQDDGSIPVWAKADISALTGMGVISGFADGEFKPGALSKRGETAKMIVAMMEAIRKSE